MAAPFMHFSIVPNRSSRFPKEIQIVIVKPNHKLKNNTSEAKRSSLALEKVLTIVCDSGSNSWKYFTVLKPPNNKTKELTRR
mmetsp:Transcript_26202/g.30040  ORF Transcript_26202/g.30040 Transcript_26202/m.30040 type:complete len:82 (+) Transcript_26202:611-856(+)